MQVILGCQLPMADTCANKTNDMQSDNTVVVAVVVVVGVVVVIILIPYHELNCLEYTPKSDPSFPMTCIATNILYSIEYS